MKRNSTPLLLFTLLFLSLLTLPTAIYGAKIGGEHQALFIAIDNYNSKVWTPLKTPVNDAKQISNLLKTKYGFSKVTTLFNEEATRTNIIETLDRITSALAPNDNLVIYFSGHGLESGNEGYWVPYEAKSQERYELLANSEVKNALSKTKSRHVLVMIDACFSSTIFKSSNLFYENDGTEAYYEKVSSLISRQAITAGGLEPVPDGNESHSIFAKYLIKFLAANEKDALDASELFEMIKYPIAANSPNMPQFGHLQNTGHEGGQFVFRLKKERLCDSEVYFEEGELVSFGKDGGVLHAKTDFKNVRYEWSYESEVIEHEGNELRVTKPGMYGVTIITEDGDCSNAAIAEVSIVLPQVVVDILEGNEVEFTYKGTLNAQVSGYNETMIYEWKKGNFVIGNKASVEVNETNIYTITIKLPDGRILGEAKANVKVKERVYEVQLGDNVRRIARKFYGDPEKETLIYQANPDLKEGEVLRMGTVLIIPSDNKEEDKVSAFTIAANQSFAPFSNPSIYQGGMLTDIVTAVYKQMNQRLNMEFIPGNQLKGVTYSGRAEVGFPFTKNKNEEMIFLYSEPLYTTLLVFFVGKDSEVVDFMKTMKERQKKGKYRKLVVAAPTGLNSDELMKYYTDKLILLKGYESLEDCFEAAKNGEVDMVAAPQVAGLVTLKSTPALNRGDFRILEKPIETNTLHLVVSKEHPNATALISAFNKTFIDLKTNGTIGKIIDTHIDLIQKTNP